MKAITKTISIATVAGIIAAVSIPSLQAGEASVAPSPHGSAAGKKGNAHPPNHPPPIPSDTRLVHSGKVLEVIDSPMYTYVRVSGKNGPLWLAAYKIEVAKGATVKYSDGIPMPNFHSQSIDRTFELIVFVDSLEQVKKQ